MKNKIIDIICICLVFVLFGSVALLNITQTNRPTESVIEGRVLAKMPEFSLRSLWDGSYFSGVSLFISDTFLYRDNLVSLSKKIDTLRGFDYSIDGEDNFVILGPVSGNQNESGDDWNDKISDALDSLKNEEKDPPVDSSVESNDPIESDPIESDPIDSDGEGSDDPGPADSDWWETDTDPIDSDSEPEEIIVNSIKISKETLKLTVGSGAALSATVDSNSPDGVMVNWSVSDSNIVSISATADDGAINVKALAEGTCTITCYYDDNVSAKCEITVQAINTNPPVNPDIQADFLTNGMFIYGDAVYTQGYYAPASAQAYAQTAAYYKALFGPKTRVSTVVIPVSAMVVDNEKVTSKIQNQGDILNNMDKLMDDSVNFVNVYPKMYANRNDYLFFKSDHHWTARGAYYAYSAFAESIGLEIGPLSEYEYAVINDQYRGSLYSYTQDERVKAFVDKIEAFIPRKNLTMTITGSNGATYNYNSCVVKGNKTYVTFIAGDNPYTVINVPENPQDKSILVLKDSFGNAFVPYLCEHYGNIFVVDVRYSTFNIYEHFADYGLTDIVFVNNIQAANTYTWSKMYLAAVGVNID